MQGSAGMQGETLDAHCPKSQVLRLSRCFCLPLYHLFLKNTTKMNIGGPFRLFSEISVEFSVYI